MNKYIVKFEPLINYPVKTIEVQRKNPNIQKLIKNVYGLYADTISKRGKDCYYDNNNNIIITISQKK